MHYYAYVITNRCMQYRKYSDEQFIEAIKDSYSWSGVLKRIGLKAGGGSYTHIQNLAKKLCLDTSHFTGQAWNIGLKFKPNPPRSLTEILTINSSYGSHYLKQRLIKEGIFEHKCYQCNRKTWNKKPIPIALDHINGVRNDNRLDNLRILCPNCHAQTDTYCGKNKSYLGIPTVEEVVSKTIQ